MVLKGDLPIDIEWYLNDLPIINGNNIGINIVMTSLRINQLTIESVNSNHRGFYKCIAKNVAGLSEYVSELKVNGE